MNENLRTIKLSPREKEVLEWAAQGKTAWETGEIMGIASNTASAYLRSAAQKLNAVSKAHAVALAITRELIPPVY